MSCEGIADVDLAVEIVDRLNVLLEDPGVAESLALLMKQRVTVPAEFAAAIADHPTIQVWGPGDDTPASIAFLGILNGIVGAIPMGPRAGWGYISARFDRDKLVGFELTRRG